MASEFQPQRNWLDLPSDLMLNILQRIGALYIYENVQKVCTAWRDICKDPAVWRRVVYIQRFSPNKSICLRLCKYVVDRSQGQLVDLTIGGFWDGRHLRYVVERSSQLRRLKIIMHAYTFYGGWSAPLKRLSLLEELIVVNLYLLQGNIETIVRCCPSLKTLRVTDNTCPSWLTDNESALAVGKYLPQLTHLELIGNPMNNVGLQAILDGCCHLESLDLGGCLKIDLTGDIGKRCSQQIKYLKL